MKLKLHTVSPIHIGTGNSLEPFEYIIENGTYYRLNQNKAFGLALEKYPDFPEKFTHWLERTSGRIQKTSDNAEQARIRSQFNFRYFCESVLNDKDLADSIIEKGYAYKCPIPFGLDGKKQIQELIKNPDNTPYIPGTSIKGALRTILAWRAFSNLTENEKTKLLTEIVNSRQFREIKGRDLDTPIEEELFVCGTEKRTKDGIKTDFSDIKFDILKFIHVSDAFSDSAEMVVYPANLYLADKEPQSQTPALETIKFNSSFNFEISINEAEFRKVYEISAKNNIGKWIDLPKKFKRMFEFYPHEIPNGELEEKIIESIKYAISDFYKAQFKHETKWLASFRREVLVQGKKRGNANIDNIKEFYEVYEEIPIMLKIGWASGFHNTTIFNVLATNEKTKPFMEKILDQFKIGIPQNKRKDPNVKPADISKFPKSRRLAAKKLDSPIDPFGWVALLDEDQNLDLE